jgi:hypothetical protein
MQGLYPDRRSVCFAIMLQRKDAACEPKDAASTPRPDSRRVPTSAGPQKIVNQRPGRRFRRLLILILTNGEQNVAGCEKSIASVLPSETDRADRRSLAQLAKRQGDSELACELWKDGVGNSRHGYDAYEQLAIYYEHKARDPQQARQIVGQALDELRRAIQVATSRQARVANSRRDLIDEWRGWNGKAGGRSWTFWPCKVRLKGE